jgi:hypothetical protein
MPFKSKAQMKAAFGGYLGPEMESKARQWAEETPNIKSLPEHKSGNALRNAVMGSSSAVVNVARRKRASK